MVRSLSYLVFSLDDSTGLDYNPRHPAEGKFYFMNAKRIVVIILGFALGAAFTLGIMILAFSYVNQNISEGLQSFGLANFTLTTLCFGLASIVILDGLLHTNMLKR